MAVIGKIRERTGFLVGFIAVALFIFLIEEGVRNSSFSGGAKKNTIGNIGTEKISATDFSQKVQAFEDKLKIVNPNLQVTDQVRGQIRDEIWNGMIFDGLLGKTLKKLGIDVTPNEMADAMYGKNPHQYAQRLLQMGQAIDPATGQVDVAKAKELFTNPDKIDADGKMNLRAQIAEVETLIKDEKLRSKYTNLVAKSFYIPTFMVKEVLNSNQTAKAAVVSIPYSSLPNDKKYNPTDAEIATYIKENAARFDLPASRTIDVVSFPLIPSKEDSVFAFNKVNTLRNDYLSTTKDSAFIARNSIQGERVGYVSLDELKQNQRTNADALFTLPVGTLTDVYKEQNVYVFTKIIDRKVAPDSVRAAHILLSMGNFSDDEKKAANKLADSLMTLLRTGQAQFGDLAFKNSQDKGSAQKGGDLGYMTRGQMVKPFEDKVFFSMKPGEVGKVETQYGLHIILVLDARNQKLVTKFADFAKEIVAGKDTEKEIFNKAVAFSQKNNTAEKFDKAARTENISKNIVLNSNMQEIPQLGQSRELVKWAFQTEKTGELHFNDKDFTDKFVIAKLTKVIQKGLAKPEDVKEEVSAILINQKKGKELVEKMQKAASGKTDLASIATTLGLGVSDTITLKYSSAYVQGIGNEPKLVGTAFGNKPGKISKPVAGENIAFIVETKAIEPSAIPETEVNTYKKQFQQMFISRLNYQTIFESIVKKAKIEDQRYKFF